MADPDPWQQAVLRIAATGVGAALAGPMGAAVGPFLGIQIGKSAVELIQSFADDSTKEAANRAANFCYNQLVKPVPAPGLEAAFRDALREALIDVQASLDALTVNAKPEWRDWFSLWDESLKRPTSAFTVADLQKVPQSSPEQQAFLENLFQSTLERLAAEQRAANEGSLSLSGHHRSLDPALLNVLCERLSVPLQARYNSHVDRSPVAAAEANRIVQQLQTSLLSSIDQRTTQIAQDTYRLPEMHAMLTQLLRAQQEGQISSEEAQTLRAERDHYAAELRKLRESTAERARTEPTEVPFAKLVAKYDLDGAEKLKVEEIRSGRAKLASDYFDLARVRELRFDWSGAIGSYEQAWDLEKNPEYGFQYARLCEKQNRFDAAISVYEEILPMAENPDKVASVLNNLGSACYGALQIDRAKQMFEKVVAVRKRQAEDNPTAYRPSVALALHNLASTYQKLRIEETETTYLEALAIRRDLVNQNRAISLPDLALTLHNIGTFYRSAQRRKEAESAYNEALLIHRELAKTNPQAYLTYVAGTLNSLAMLFHDDDPIEAEIAYKQALTIYRELAEINQEAYLSDVAMALNNLASLYSDSKRPQESVERFQEALAIRRELAVKYPSVYLPDVASTLLNLAVLESDTEPEVAMKNCLEAAEILEPFWTQQPTVHGDDMARIWLRLAILLGRLGRPAIDLFNRALTAAYDPELKQGIQVEIHSLSQ